MNPRPRPPAGQAAAASSDPGDVPGDVRDQIRRLQDDGGSYRAIAAAAGLAPATVHGLALRPPPAHPRHRPEPCPRSPAAPCAAPASTPAAPGCGCAPCTSWATAPPASPAPWASAR